MSPAIPASLKAVVFDWAGTMVDFGSRAPVIALCRLFEEQGVPISDAEAYADMGRAKWDHIARLLAIPRVSAAWEAATGAPPSAENAARLFAEIGPMMQAAARDCAVLIPGAAGVAEQLRAAGVKIGSCTGYTREMMEHVLPIAAEQGYAPDCVVCAGDTAEGRPSPLMAWKNLVELGVWPASACVKVDDTPVGIAEGCNAGMWTVGVAASGSELGLSLEQVRALDPADRDQRVAQAKARLSEAGAHCVIESVADLPAALQDLPIGTPPPARPA